MLQRERYAANAELKYRKSETGVGELTGYASVFGVEDVAGDVIEPTAFDKTLADHKSKGTLPFMFAEHSAYQFGGDPLPIGKWTEMTVDEKGLKVTGHLIALDHPDVKRVHDLMLEDVMGGISIAFSTHPDGVTWGTKANEPRRRISSLELYSADPVCDPANHLARIDSVKSANQMAAVELRNAVALVSEMPDNEERALLQKHLERVYKEVTGEELKTRSKPETIRQFEDWLRDAATQFGFKYSNSEARALSEGRAWKKTHTADPREEEAKSKRRAFGDIGHALSGFSLPKIGD
jgi:HK97 family phage prohead protease